MTYSCKNRPLIDASKPLWVQDGYVSEYHPASDDVVRHPKMVAIPFVNTVTCQYTLTTPDHRCDGCFQQKHEYTPEEMNNVVR